MSFEDLLTGELEWLGRMARCFYANRADAEDLLGETVCRMIENKDKFAPSLPFKPWAKAVMSNIYITAYNRRRLAPMGGLDEGYQAVSDSSAEMKAEIGSLLSLLERLSKKSVCVDAVRKYAVRGLSYDEIAAELDVGADVVKTRIATGRKIIRRALGISKN